MRRKEGKDVEEEIKEGTKERRVEESKKNKWRQYRDKKKEKEVETGEREMGKVGRKKRR